MIKITPANEAPSPAPCRNAPGKPLDGIAFAQVFQSSLVSCDMKPGNQPEPQLEQLDTESPSETEEKSLHLATELIFLPQPISSQSLWPEPDQDSALRPTSHQDSQSALSKGLRPDTALTVANEANIAETPASSLLFNSEGNLTDAESDCTGVAFGHWPNHPLSAERAGAGSQQQIIADTAVSQPNRQADQNENAPSPLEPMATYNAETAETEESQEAWQPVVESRSSQDSASRQPSERLSTVASATPDIVQRRIESPQASQPNDRSAPSAQTPSSIDWSPIVDSWSMRTAPGPQQWTVRLRPDEFGQVQIHLEQLDQGLVARIVADQALTTELLRSQLLQLDSALQDQGIHCQRLEVLCEPSTSGAGLDDQSGRQPDHPDRETFQDRSSRQSASPTLTSTSDQPASKGNNQPLRIISRFEHWT